MTKMYEKILTSPVKYPRTVSRTARDLIDKLLKKNAYQRLGAAPNGATFVKRHPWWKVNFFNFTSCLVVFGSLPPFLLLVEKFDSARTLLIHFLKFLILMFF